MEIPIRRQERNGDEDNEFDHRPARFRCLLRCGLGMRSSFHFPGPVGSASSAECAISTGASAGGHEQSAGCLRRLRRLTVVCFPDKPNPAMTISTVGLAERVDPAHAPYPTNESERLLFRQLYETLIRADCAGTCDRRAWQLPGVSMQCRNTWIVTLRPNARFSDNTPVTAADVVSSWMSGNGSELRPEVRRLVRSIVAVDDRTLEITLQSRRADAVLALAHTDLAIANSRPRITVAAGNTTRQDRSDDAVRPIDNADQSPWELRPFDFSLLRP